MTKIKGKQALMEALLAEGVEYIFGNPGTSESPIMDALEDYPQIKYILALQEGVAMGMADAYGRATGKPAFVNLHIHTGLGNGISLLNNANEGGTPLVLTAGNQDIRKLSSGRIELARMCEQFSKWSVEVTHPGEVSNAIRRAFNEAKTPPTGPAFVAFSANALDDEADVWIEPSARGFHRTVPDAESVAEAVKLLRGARNPMLLVGDRVAQSGGAAEVVRLAELTGARVYAPGYYSEMNFPTGHSQFLGLVNPVLPSSRELFAKMDVIVAVGVKVFHGFFYFDGRPLPQGTKLVHIDCAVREVGKVVPPEVGIIADPKTALACLSDDLESNMTGPEREAAKLRIAAIAEENKVQKEAFQRRLKATWNMRPMSSERMMAELFKALPFDVVIADDSVSSRGALFDAVKFNEPGSIFGERGGSLGWGMGGTLGLKLANPHRPVVGIVGDGSSLFTVQAIWTALNYNIPVTWVICNNRSYRVLKLNMDTYLRQVGEKKKSRYIGMDFPIPLNLASIAQAFGAPAEMIEDPEALSPALKRAIDSGKPYLLDVVIDGSV